MLAVVPVAGLEVIEPAAEPLDGLGALAQRNGPLVDVLAVEAVHEEGFALGLHSRGGGAVGEAVLHAKYEPLHRRENGRDVLRHPQEIVVDVVAQRTVVP